MDYRDMLIRYMMLVGWQEGTTFVSEHIGDGLGLFTEDEWREMVRLDDESASRFYRWRPRLG